MTNLKQALDYAARGWAVFPLHTPIAGGCSCGNAECGRSAGKHPRTRSGVKDATTDEATIRKWWTAWPDANVGLATGAASNVVVVDLDGEQGVEAFQRRAEQFGGMPATLEAATGGGGRHLFFKMPAGEPIRNRAKIDGEPVDVRGEGGYVLVAPSLHKSGKRYQWADAAADVVEAPAWLLDWIRPRPHQPAAVSPSRVSYATQDRTSIERRVLEYLAACPIAVAGSNGSGETIKACGAVAVGFDLSEEQAYTLLQDWNSRCKPSWSEYDLRRKIAEAVKTSNKPRGYLLNESLAIEPAAFGVDFSNLDAASTRPAIVAPAGSEPVAVEADVDEADLSPLDPGPFPLDVIDNAPGILRDIIKFDLETTLYPQPVLALAGAISLLSVVTGRKVRGYWNVRTNVMVVGLLESGGGKNHSRELVKGILSKAGAGNFVGPERIGSHAGIITRMHKNPATLFPIDEIGDTFSLIKKNEGKLGSLANIEPLLKTLYSSAGSDTWTGDALANSDHVKTIKQPHLVLYGVCPADNFFGNLTAANVENGLMARFLVFEAGRGDLAWKDDPTKPLPSNIVEFIRNWFVFSPGAGNLSDDNPTPVTATYTPEAMAIFRQHAEAINARMKADDKRSAAIWARCAEKTSKLALVAACARCPFPADRVPVVGGEDMQWGKRIALWTTRRMLFQIAGTMAESAEDERKKRLLKLIPEAPEKISIAKLGLRSRQMKPSERAASLKDMYDCGMIFRETIETTGRPLTLVWKPARRRPPDSGDGAAA